MKRFTALLLIVGVLVVMTSAVDASTSWVARLGSHGTASLRIGSPDHLTLSVTGMRASTRYAVTLRHGTCASLGTLVVASRITTSTNGAARRTIELTAVQTGAARLPLAVRVGSRCAAFAAPAVVPPTPSASPSARPSLSPSASPELIPSPYPSAVPMPTPPM